MLELGGNAALVVHSDWKNLDDAASRTAHGAFGFAASPASAFSACLWSAASSRPLYGRSWKLRKR
ncbi:MAG: hypothetical protein WDM87_16665 [Terracidiphilus sp.]